MVAAQSHVLLLVGRGGQHSAALILLLGHGDLELSRIEHGRLLGRLHDCLRRGWQPPDAPPKVSIDQREAEAPIREAVLNVIIINKLGFPTKIPTCFIITGHKSCTYNCYGDYESSRHLRRKSYLMMIAFRSPANPTSTCGGAASAPRAPRLAPPRPRS